LDENIAVALIVCGPLGKRHCGLLGSMTLHQTCELQPLATYLAAKMD